MSVKKAAVRILQTEVHSQQEWDALLQRPGLGVVDVYASWCGPCKAIISLFRKIRNEAGDQALFFATADTDAIDSLADYRGKSQPTFLFYGDGQLVSVLRGCNGPKITKLIQTLVKKEKQIAEGLIDREVFIDTVVCKEVPEEKKDENKEQSDEGEEEMVPQEVTVVIIKPDAVEAGLVDDISQEITAAGYDILEKVERPLTPEEVAELYRQDEGDAFEQLIEFMTSGPCVAVALCKAGDAIGENIVAEVMTLVGPSDVNTAKEEAPESLRAKFGSDSLHNAIHCSTSPEDAAREFAFFFPHIEKPTVQQLIQQKTLQRTLALIRPNAFARKNSIIKTIEDSGFLIAMQKDIQFTEELAQQFYSSQKDEECYESLITNMTSGPSVAICLTKNKAVQAWKDMLAPKPVAEPTDDDESEVVEEDTSLQVKFGLPEDSCLPLHAADTVEQFEREMKVLFPMENTVALIQPDTYNNPDEIGAIKSKFKHAGFNIQEEKEVTLTNEQVSLLYKEHTEKEYFGNLMQYMSSGPSLFLILAREDAIDGLNSLIGPEQPDQAKEAQPNSLRAQFGKDEIRNAVYACSNKESVVEVIKEFFAEILVGEDGVVAGSAEVDGIVVEASSPDAAPLDENTESGPEAPQQTSSDQPISETEVSAGGDVTDGHVEPTTDVEPVEEGEPPGDGEPPSDGEPPADGEPPVDGELPVDGEPASDGETPAEEESPVTPTTGTETEKSDSSADVGQTDGASEAVSQEATLEGQSTDTLSQLSREATIDVPAEVSSSTGGSREATMTDSAIEASDTTPSNTDVDTA